MLCLAEVVGGGGRACELEEGLCEVGGVDYVDDVLVAPVACEVVEDKREVELDGRLAVLDIERSVLLDFERRSRDRGGLLLVVGERAALLDSAGFDVVEDAREEDLFVNEGEDLSEVKRDAPAKFEVRAAHAEDKGLGDELAGRVLLAEVEGLVVLVGLLLSN